MTYDDTNRALLFPNDRRGNNKKAPNAKGDGSITIPSDYLAERWNGEGALVVISLSAWTHEDKNKKKFLSVKFEIKGQWKKQSPQTTTQPPERDQVEEDGSIPF